MSKDLWGADDPSRVAGPGELPSDPDYDGRDLTGLNRETDPDAKPYNGSLVDDCLASVLYAAKEATLFSLTDSGMSFDEAFKRVFSRSPSGVKP